MKDLEKIEREVADVGGRLEWVTEHGVGISFPEIPDEDVLQRIPVAIGVAVWISFENTGAGDSALAHLEGAPRLESVRLVGTRVTTGGLVRLLTATPTIQEIGLSSAHLDRDELSQLRKMWPKLSITEKD